MFVHRTRGVVAATLGVLGLGLAACDDPEQNTELRPEGPPDVLAVLVMTDAAGQLVEQATFCKANDEKRPSLVGLPDFTTQQVCPINLSETVPTVDSAYPDGWYVRIMFDELLDPSIETLTEVIDADTGEPTDTYVGSIATTHPVKLECENMAGAMVNIDYDGYYSPSGNRITWPLGPSIVIKPNDPTLIATSSNCQVTINDNVVDKSGTPVEASQRGPYKFGVAPIKLIAIDPPDDPEYDDPVPATQIYFDNFYLQFNTAVDVSSLCPENGNDVLGFCDEEIVKFKSVSDPSMPTPGKCDTTEKGCLTVADCDAANGDTYCGRGYCDYNGTICRDFADCDAAAMDTNCTYNTVYSLAPFGLSEAEFGAGPVMALATESKYTFEIPAGTKLKDRCGRETTLGPPSVDDLTLVHFATAKFDFAKASIVTGETAQAVKKPQLNFTNVVEGGDLFGIVTATAAIPALSITTLDPSEWSMTPLPFLNATTPLTQTQTAIAAADLSGQIMFRGHYQLNTEYTLTINAGATVNDMYGKTWTNPEAMVIKWKTEPAIRVTSLGLRDTNQLISAVNNGTVVKNTPTDDLDVRIGFNQAMDVTTIGLDDISVEPAPTGLAVASQSGCGTTSTSCTLRIRGKYPPGTYKITLKKGAMFKDLFGVEYTQAADQTITVDVEEAPAVTPCL
jgi:hypothetical protein